MNILKEILKNEVYPALGCTEPVSVAYATSKASSLIKNIDLDNTTITVNMDPGTYKNGYGVNLPNIIGEKGNLIGASLGVIIKKPELKNKIFSIVKEKDIKLATDLIKKGHVFLNVDYTKKELYVEAIVKSKNDTAICILKNGHFNISFLSLNDKKIKTKELYQTKQQDYKELLKSLSMSDLVKMANNADENDLKYIKKGIDINLKATEKGKKLDKVSNVLNKIYTKNIVSKDIIRQAQILCTSATDARMNGIAYPIMSSGQSGNQGVVAILVPYIIGKKFKVKKEKVLKSIALTHIINSYIKAYTGELSPVCGCAISSGAGASAAIVYQSTTDIRKIEDAINNVFADISGLICDGAKETCSLKVATSVEVAIRNAFLALNGITANSTHGFIDNDATKTIKNMARLSIIGMSSVDSIIIETMKNK